MLDSTTESDLALQQDQDDAEAMQDTARYARRIRKRLGLTQFEFARRIAGTKTDRRREKEKSPNHFGSTCRAEDHLD